MSYVLLIWLTICRPQVTANKLGYNMTCEDKVTPIVELVSTQEEADKILLSYNGKSSDYDASVVLKVKSYKLIEIPK